MIYMDNAATTKLAPGVLEAMLPWMTKNYGNPSASYDFAIDARQKIAECRKIIAELIGAEPDEIYFTSGGTESDQWAIQISANGHMITDSIEHHAILNNVTENCTVIGVDKYGAVDIGEFVEAIQEDTDFVTIMTANNEIGTIQPIDLIGEICQEFGCTFHTDAVQAFGHIPINVKDMKVDMLSASSHKFHGPKGVGFLYIKNGTPISPLIKGGGQQNGMRAGTENVAGIVGMTRAAVIATSEPIIYKKKLIQEILEIPGSHLNGHPENRLPNNANFSFDGVRGEELIALLNSFGVCASTGSACTTGEPSHVLKAIGQDADNSLRLTTSMFTTDEEIDETIKYVKQSVEILRNDVR